MAEEMTPKERWLAAIRMEPVDRLPFWPKLDAAYPRAQDPPFNEMRATAIHDWIGSDKHFWITPCAKEVRTKTSVETSRDNGTMRTVYETPHGRTELVRSFDEASQSWHPRRFPVGSLEDVKVMTEIYEDVTVELDAEGLEKAAATQESVGQGALTQTGIGESPLMHWVEWLAGVERAHLMLLDYQDEVERLFAAMHRVLLEKAKVLAEHSPSDVLYMVENTSTTLISPDQYRTYCAPHITDYGTVVADAGGILILHMCGHLKALLPDLAKVPARAFEAFTSPTLGNTTLLDGRTACPDKCLVGGTNAMLWTRGPEEIAAQVEADLDSLPHHRGIVVTSAGVMPPLCAPETIKAVCERVKAYPARM
ncbi:MAG: uroporphyrinogen decarboxylase family protein [Planctomycetota bacterium]|jgi:uroporphyrinogen-III decarboxylase